MTGIIYKITNKINGKVYIGKTKGALQHRWYHHLYGALSGKLHTKLSRAIRKYGAKYFVIEELEHTSSLNKREQFYIRKFNSIEHGYNLKIGGEGGPHHAETKKKISKANRKRIWTNEMRKNMSIAIKKWHKKRGFVPRTEECRRKISKANEGRKMSEKTKLAFQKHNNKHKRPIVSLDTGIEYSSITEACKILKINDGHLRMHLKGKHDHVKGMRFAVK